MTLLRSLMLVFIFCFTTLPALAQSPVADDLVHPPKSPIYLDDEIEPSYREEGPDFPAEFGAALTRAQQRLKSLEDENQAENPRPNKPGYSVKVAPGKRASTGVAKNVILFIGDGMGVSTVTAARILDGQQRGEPGEENLLSFEQFPNLALSKTYNTNQQVPDSAGTMTAMMSGIKTKAGVIGVNPNVVRGNYSTVLGNSLPTLLEVAELVGMSTGVVSTARLTHATPAACYSHSPERNWEANSNLPADAAAAGFPDIASQLIDFPFGDGLEVAMGGGRRNFMPNTLEDPEDLGNMGRRTDGRDLTAEWVAKNESSAFVWNQAQFDAIDPESTDHLLGLFERSHMEYEHDRLGDAGGEPSIAQMTSKAIDILSRNEDGFFLMVESGRIDHAHHGSNAYRSLTDTLAFADAVEAAVSRVDLSETLILVTADHSHVFTIAGYPTRGNDILGKVIGNDSSGEIAPDYMRDATGLPFTTLSYANGPGWQETRPDLERVDTQDPDYLQESTVPLSSETHSGEDVALYATGPGSDAVRGVVEQSFIFHVMYDALFRN